MVFLPGAGGDPAFWRPVGERLPATHTTYLGWPGLGDQPPAANVNGLEDLVRRVEVSLGVAPVDLLAQSMGGVVALLVALRHPQRVRRLVLVATSGGLDVAALGGEDWRPAYRAAFPQAAQWIMEARVDLSSRLSAMEVPTLLVWGDADGISPPAVGQALASRLPKATLHVVPGGDHDLVQTHASVVAPVIARFLGLPGVAPAGMPVTLRPVEPADLR